MLHYPAGDMSCMNATHLSGISPCQESVKLFVAKPFPTLRFLALLKRLPKLFHAHLLGVLYRKNAATFDQTF